jgi:hypothetical protein
MECCVIGGAMGAIERRIDAEDAEVFVEDLMSLKRYFVQRDDDGNVAGLDEERVAAKTSRFVA